MVIFDAVLERWLTTLRTRGETFERQILAAHLANLRGLESRIDLASVYRDFSELASARTLERLLEASEAATTAERRPLERLTEFVGTNLEHAAAAETIERRLELEARMMVSVEGQSWPYRSLPIRIQNSPNPAERAALNRALVTARVEVATLHADAHARARDAAAEASGEDDYVRWRSRLCRFDLDALAREAAELLAGTDDMAQEALAWLLRGRVELASDQPPSLSDLSFALRAADLDSLLATGELWRVDDFLSRLGLEPTAQGRIIRDTDERAGKSPRAYCVPLVVPDEVYLVLQPGGGLPRWRALLHEMGHALHNANTAPGAPFEHRRLGEPSLSEGYAVLFDHLLVNPIWARRVLRLSPPDAERLARTAAAAALLVTRRHAAKLIHEIAYHRGDPEEADRYVELLHRATGVAPTALGHQADIDPELYCSRYVRAWMFEAIAHQELRERYDEDWFLNPQAGALLLDLFSREEQPDLEDLVVQVFDTPLSIKPIIDRFLEVLG